MIDITFDPRAAGEITRFHTWRRLRDQSVGEHSWQILRIMLTVWPDCPRRVMVHAVLHDVGEVCGDVPYPFKKNDPAMKTVHDKTERECHEQMSMDWALPPPVVLSHDEETFFKLCEYVEMWEYGLTEANMGNAYARLVAERCILQASLMVERMPAGAVREAVHRYCRKRTEHEGAK